MLGVIFTHEDKQHLDEMYAEFSAAKEKYNTSLQELVTTEEKLNEQRQQNETK